jgi:hypothetical protein
LSLVTSSVLGPTIFLNKLLANYLSLRFSVKCETPSSRSV